MFALLWLDTPGVFKLRYRSALSGSILVFALSGVICQTYLFRKGDVDSNVSRGYTVQTRIKEYRSRLSMTQDDLARKVGVRRETIVFLEQGKYNPSLRLAHDVSRSLHARIDDLFIFDDDAGPKPGTAGNTY